ncbi:anchored repeat-type ABC transporter ATP-binding subunit [Mariniluteicoccus flavus]
MSDTRPHDPRPDTPRLDVRGVDVRGVAVDLGGRRVLSDIDLAVDAGELLGLVGPNGAGKTTLLRTLLGLVRPVAGTVTVEGRTPARASRRLGYVPQRHEFAWDFPISVEAVVMSGRVRHIGWLRQPGVADHRLVRRALARVRLTDLADRTVGQLSGSQRQRVLIARALATDPSILLLDEPFTGVDMPTQELLGELFRALAAEGTTVVMTTHDLADAMASCDRICLVNRRIVADGTPDDVRDPELWMRAFGVSATSPLLASVGAATSSPATVPTDSREDVAC